MKLRCRELTWLPVQKYRRLVDNATAAGLPENVIMDLRGVRGVLMEVLPCAAV
jgi:hypothetical protein